MTKRPAWPGMRRALVRSSRLLVLAAVLAGIFVMHTAGHAMDGSPHGSSVTHGHSALAGHTAHPGPVDVLVDTVIVPGDLPTVFAAVPFPGPTVTSAAG